MNVAIYLRLSMADGDLVEKDKKESNSIENQRLLLQEYIMRNPELYSDVIEYVDDGYSGTNFDRPAFQQMITDAQSGLIQVVLVKDLSRLGRNYIEMGDYLDQIFPRLGVRVIAVSSGYDSDKHLGDVSGMDTAITNFINAMYSRDLSVRLKSVYKTLVKKGDPPSSLLPYGYRKNPDEKRGWLVDTECADAVRKIFEMAAEGYRLIEISDYLNENKVKLPGDRMAELYNHHPRTVLTDKEYVWDTDRVRVIIRNYNYTGACIAHQTESDIYDYRKVHYLPKSEWVIIEDHHEPLVDKKTFQRAQLIIRSVASRDRKKEAIYSLKKKLRCGNCHLTFTYRDDNKVFYCSHKSKAGKYSNCSNRQYKYPEMEKKVLMLLKKHLADFKWLDLIAKNAIELIAPTYTETKKNNSDRIEILKAERVRQYEGYAEGLISKDAYLKEKEKLTEEIELLEAELKEIANHEREDEQMLRDIEKTSQKAEYVIGSPILTQYISEQFIKNVYIHDWDRIEIVYKTEDLIGRTIARNNEIMDALTAKEGETEVSHHYQSRYVKLMRESNLIEKNGGKKT